MGSIMFDKFIANQAAKIEKVRTRQSNTKMNLIKTYSIIAVVAGHCRGGSQAEQTGNHSADYEGHDLCTGAGIQQHRTGASRAV